jgi:hypothetical protein
VITLTVSEIVVQGFTGLVALVVVAGVALVFAIGPARRRDSEHERGPRRLPMDTPGKRDVV